MEKITFRENENSRTETMVIRVSEEIYSDIIEISRRTSLPVYAVADRLISFALEHTEWEKDPSESQ
ncbi:MAG: hypothetical protein GX860_09995 [Alcaligenaceae bacterium]|nr:hypothetical protein [Alcaligenaceae bacterium]